MLVWLILCIFTEVLAIAKTNYVHTALMDAGAKKDKAREDMIGNNNENILMISGALQVMYFVVCVIGVWQIHVPAMIILIIALAKAVFYTYNTMLKNIDSMLCIGLLIYWIATL